MVNEHQYKALENVEPVCTSLIIMLSKQQTAKYVMTSNPGSVIPIFVQTST